MQANKNGYFYVLDRVNGEYISAGEMSQISWARGIDSKGRPMVNPEAYYTSERGVTVYPVQMHNTSQMSYSPQTGWIYVPINPSSSYSLTAVENYAPRAGAADSGSRISVADVDAVPPEGQRLRLLRSQHLRHMDLFAAVRMVTPFVVAS